MKDITIEQMLVNNPQIDKEILKKSMELLKEMRKAGLKAHKYSLTSPYVRRIAKANLQRNRVTQTRR